MEVFKLAELSKDIMEIFFLSLFMNSCDQYNPTFDCCNQYQTKPLKKICYKEIPIDLEATFKHYISEIHNYKLDSTITWGQYEENSNNSWHIIYLTKDQSITWFTICHLWPKSHLTASNLLITFLAYLVAFFSS